VVFTFPENGQVDVPVGARLIVTLSGAVQGTPSNVCTASSDGGLIAGDVCLIGPNGPQATTLSISGSLQNILVLQPVSNLLPGGSYSVFVNPGVLGGSATNLPSSGPLFSFTARQDSMLSGVQATVVAINDQDPAVFEPDGPAPSLPFVSFMSVRAVFSEPVDPSTFVLGQTVRFAAVGAGGALTDVPGQLYVDDIHLTFDPTDDLDPGTTYQLQLNPGLMDLGGEPLQTPLQFLFHPLAASATGTVYPQTLAVTPPGSASGVHGAISALSGQPTNSIDVHSPLIGQPVLASLAGAIQSTLADPSAFGGPIPLTIRAGQRLDLSPLAISLGGAVPTPYASGTLHMIFLTDANGIIRRNPYRPADTEPDDTTAPVSVDFTFDALLFSDDAQGNVLTTQSLYGVHLCGTSKTDGTELAIDTVGTMEFGALGVAKATGNVTFRLETNPSAALTTGTLASPELTAASPYGGQTDFPPDAPILLFFSRPVDVGQAVANQSLALTDASGSPVPFAVRQDGSSLILTPTGGLGIGESYTLSLDGLVDVFGNPIPPAQSDPTGGTGILPFQTQQVTEVVSTAAILTALDPGAPCALEGGDGTNPGHCVGGQSGDLSYQPFQMRGMQSVVARFSQPMLASSMTLGQSCGSGSVRVERVDANGQCIGVVPGTLVLHQRGFDFVPNAAWQPGQTYQLTLFDGNDAFCASGGICSAAATGRTLNSTPLNGIADTLLTSQGGGTDVVIPFTGMAPAAETTMTLSAEPYADANGDGAVDGAETVADGNRLAIEITNTTGFIDSSSALLGSPCDASSPTGSACQSLQQDLPIAVEAAVSSCPVDADGNPTADGAPCVPSRLSPQTIQLTGLNMNISTLGGILNLNNVPSGMLLMRLLQPDPGGIVGYIIDEPGTTQSQFIVTTSVYVDAPDLVLAGGLATHNLHSYPSTVTLKGPVTFLPDGRLQVASTNLADVVLVVQSSAIGLSGTMTLTVPAGQLDLTLVGAPIK
jgi:hypothetical protein